MEFRRIGMRTFARILSYHSTFEKILDRNR